MNNDLHIADEWLKYIPLLHRVLANPAQQKTFPKLQASLKHTEVCAYWETLYYIFRTLIGWDRLDKGLEWWYSIDKNDQNEPLLQLVQKVWNNKNQLDYFAAWAWTQECYLTPEEIYPARICNSSSYNDENWWSKFKIKGKQFNYDPFYGGTDSLHLFSHLQEFEHVKNEAKSPTLYYDIDRREATILTSCFVSWRCNLKKLGASLPLIGNRSWKVEVFDRHVGYIGKFRQSRETGKWFMGKHSVHIRGN